jgi:hypothetical protein
MFVCLSAYDPQMNLVGAIFSSCLFPPSTDLA